MPDATTPSADASAAASAAAPATAPVANAAAAPGGEAAKAPAAAPADPKAAWEKSWADFKVTDDVKEVAEFAKASGFPPQAVAALAAREKARAEKEEAEFKHLSEKGWLEELQKDPELGGAKVRETMVDAMRAHDRLDPKIQAMIKEAGVLYNPVVVRILHDIGTKLKEDSFVRPGASPAAEQKLSAEDRLKAFYAGITK